MNAVTIVVLGLAYGACGIGTLVLDGVADRDENDDTKFGVLGFMLIVLFWPIRLVMLICQAYDEYWHDDEVRSIIQPEMCGCKKCKAEDIQ